MSDTKEKIVDFFNYCKYCKHYKDKATDDPCNECLSEPVNWDSRKPVRFEEKKN